MSFSQHSQFVYRLIAIYFVWLAACGHGAASGVSPRRDARSGTYDSWKAIRNLFLRVRDVRHIGAERTIQYWTFWFKI